jgi:hypothetical protein
VLLPRQQAKLARGAKDKEHAMSQTPKSKIRTPPPEKNPTSPSKRHPLPSLCKEHKISTVIGDLYGHQWTQEAWRSQGMTYVASDLSASMLYLEVLPLFSRGLVSLPDHPILLRELRLLERIPGRVGKDQVKSASKKLSRRSGKRHMRLSSHARKLSRI